VWSRRLWLLLLLLLLLKLLLLLQKRVVSQLSAPNAQLLLHCARNCSLWRLRSLRVPSPLLGLTRIMMPNISPSEAQRRKNEDELEALLQEARIMLAKAPPEKHAQLLRSAGLLDVWEHCAWEPVWRRCRHGGPAPTPLMMEMVDHLLTPLAPCIAPRVQYARLLEMAILRDGCSPPAIVFASMGVDAWINDDIGNVRRFILAACVLDAASGPAGPEAFFAQLRETTQTRAKQEQFKLRAMGKENCAICLRDATDKDVVLPCGHRLHADCQARMQDAGMHICPLCKRPLVPVLEKFEDRLGKCKTSTKAMQSVIEEFVTCDCIARAMRVGMGVGARQTALAESGWSGRHNSYDNNYDCHNRD